MSKPKSSLPTLLPATGAAASALHRSGTVARMLGMPVATLRVWERRYGLTQPALTPSGQRLYSANDVRRLTLIKQLTGLGHAIGSVAPLNMEQLQRVAATHAQALAATQPGERAHETHAPPLRAWRLAVIGAALGSRLQRPALLRQLGRHVALLGPFDDVAQAVAAQQGSHLDALLIHEPHLHAGWLAAFEAAAPAFADVPKAILYSFAADDVCEALGSTCIALLREPQPDTVVAQWLNGLSSRVVTAPRRAAELAKAETVPQRRWSDLALADFANLSPTIACECPRHVAELLMQLSHFEAYSAECENRNDADAELHAYLRQVAAAARARFEAALEYVALHEGLLLPSSAWANDVAGVPHPRRAQALAAAGPGRSTRAETGTVDTDSHGSV